jgi:hypothetical protein
VLVTRKHEGKRHKQCFIARVAKRAGLEGKIGASLDEAVQHIIRISERYRAYKQAHVDKRMKWIEGLAAAQLDFTGQDGEDEQKLNARMKMLQQREAIRRCHRVIKWSIQGEQAKQSIFIVIARDPDGSQRECPAQE